MKCGTLEVVCRKEERLCNSRLRCTQQEYNKERIEIWWDLYRPLYRLKNWDSDKLLFIVNGIWCCSPALPATANKGFLTSSGYEKLQVMCCWVAAVGKKKKPYLQFLDGVDPASSQHGLQCALLNTLSWVWWMKISTSKSQTRVLLQKKGGFLNRGEGEAVDPRGAQVSRGLYEWLFKGLQDWPPIGCICCSNASYGDREAQWFRRPFR